MPIPGAEVRIQKKPNLESRNFLGQSNISFESSKDEKIHALELSAYRLEGMAHQSLDPTGAKRAG